MTESIMSNEKVCFRCYTPLNLQRHHIYGGHGRRSQSEKYGCWVWLCAKHHTGDAGVHFNRDYDEALKMQCQWKWEKIYGSRDDFRRVFGRSYL